MFIKESIYNVFDDDFCFIYEYIKWVLVCYIAEDDIAGDYELADDQEGGGEENSPKKIGEDMIDEEDDVGLDEYFNRDNNMEVDERYNNELFYNIQNGIYVMTDDFIEFSERFFYYGIKKKLIEFDTIKMDKLVFPDQLTISRLIDNYYYLLESISQEEKMDGLVTRKIPIWLMTQYERESFKSNVSDGFTGSDDLSILLQYRPGDLGPYMEISTTYTGFSRMFIKETMSDNIIEKKSNKVLPKDFMEKIYGTLKKGSELNSIQKELIEKISKNKNKKFFNDYYKTNKFDPVMEHYMLELINVSTKGRFDLNMYDIIYTHDNISYPIETNDFYNSFYCKIILTPSGFCIWDVNIKKFLAYKTFSVCFIIFVCSLESNYKNMTKNRKKTQRDNYNRNT